MPSDESQEERNPQKPTVGTKAPWKQSATGGPQERATDSPGANGATQHPPAPTQEASEAQGEAVEEGRLVGPSVQKRKSVRKSSAAPKPKKVKKQTSRKPTGERTAPANVPIPRSGLRAMVYRLNSASGRPDKVPKLSAKDQFYFELFYEQLWLRYLALRQDLRCVIAFICDSGGASKSTTTVGIGSVLADVSRKSVYAIPATTNLKTGALAAVAGIEEGMRYTIGEYFGDLDKLQTTLDVSSRVTNTPAGLNVVAGNHRSDSGSDGSPDDEQELSSRNAEELLMMFKTVATHLRPHVDFLLLDTGNDDAFNVSVPVATAEVADVIVFTATADHQQSKNVLAENRDMFLRLRAAHNFTEGSHESYTWLNQIPTHEKARQSLTLISKTHPGEGQNEYGQYGYGGDQVLLVPYDDSIANTGIVDIYEMSDVTLLAYTKAATTILERVAQLRGIELPERVAVLPIPKAFRSS